MKKCVVIGSGLGGLSCGCILAKNGYEVTVLEQGSQIGGCLQCFRRGDSLFDTGMHYIGSADEGQVLHTILHYLGVDSNLQLSRLNPTGYDIISYQGEHYPLANGRDGFIDRLSEQLPGCRDELQRYYDLTTLVASSSPMHDLNRHVDLNIFAEYQTRSTSEVISSVVKHPVLKEVLAGILPLYAGEKDRTPFSLHALIFDFYNQSAFRIVGGSSAVADSLARSIRDMGGHVLTRHKASKIVCNDSCATAVQTVNGQQFPADLIVSSIHPASTIDLVDSHLLRPAYRRRIQSLRNTTGSFTVYLKFRKDHVPYMNSNLYYYRSSSVWDWQKNGKEWPQWLLYMHFCHIESNHALPQYAQTGEILTYMSYDEVRQWSGTSIGHRGEDYEEFKRKKAEAVIKALEEEVPGINDQIEQYYVSTPLTYQDYTGTLEGSIYGVARDVQTLVTGTVNCRTSIPNLLLTGQSTTCHGMLGVLASSLVTCSEVIGMDTLLRQLK